MEAVSDERTGGALVEGLDGHGRVLWRERLGLAGGRRRFTVGRAVDADVTLDDPHVAALHAAVELGDDGRWRVSDLGSANGLVVAGRRHHGAADLELDGGLLQVGRTRLRLRSSHDPLAPEQPDRDGAVAALRDPAWIVGLGAVAGALQLAYSSWLGAPRDLTSALVSALIAGGLVVGVWVTFWALLSRMILGEWRWLRHAAIFLGVAVVSQALEGLLGVASFALALPEWPAGAVWGGGLAVACALYLHLSNASHISTRRAVIVACLVPALSVGVGYWVQDRTQARNVNYIRSALRIYPPALRLRDARTIDSLFEDSQSLRAEADERRDATEKYVDDGDEYGDAE